MNKFDLSFFNKYIPEGQNIKGVVHIHPIRIFLTLLVKGSLLVVIPIVFYYNSIRIQEIIPFFCIEIYLFLMYFKFVYDVFDWYNDVWILTDSAVISLEWSFLKSNSDTINYENIEGIGVEAEGIFDKILKKGNLVIHKIGSDDFVLYDAVNPFKAVDLIEQYASEKDEGGDEQKFDIIMDALSGVVGDYLHENKIKEKEKVTKQDKIEKIKQDKRTLDLR